jgi:hypothetical protein
MDVRDSSLLTVYSTIVGRVICDLRIGKQHLETASFSDADLTC